MVMLRYRSRSKIRNKLRTPGGKLVLHHRSRKSGNHRCGNCRSILAGVSHKNILSYKRPSRMHGGSLCTQCVKAIIINMVEGMI